MREGHQTVAITARGTYCELDGTEKPSPFVVTERPGDPGWKRSRGSEPYADKEAALGALREIGGSIELDDAGEVYPRVYLVYCSPNTAGGHGSYKYYKLSVENGMTQAEYGRIGHDAEHRGFWGPSAGKHAKPLPSWVFWLRYREKLAKGYKDLSSVCFADARQDMLFLGLEPGQADALIEAGVSGVKELAGLTVEELACVEGIGEDQAAEIGASMLAHGIALAEASCEGDAPSSEEERESRELYNLLQGLASSYVCASLRAPAEDVTAAMVVKAKALAEKLGEIGASTAVGDAEKVREANQVIVETMLVSPRSADSVSSLLVTDPQQIAAAADREKALADSMEAVVTGRVKTGGSGSLASVGVNARLATEAERAEVMGLVPDPYTWTDAEGYEDRIERIWRLEPQAQLERYERYLAEKGIRETRLLFHGSSNASWFSCIASGLMLSYAGIHGKAFGRAHYFANKLDKSVGYTDGGRWDSGPAADSVYVGVYDVAYGNALRPSERRDVRLEQTSLEAAGYNSAHARKGDGPLKNDEIMVYSDAACCIKYLVELRRAA